MNTLHLTEQELAEITKRNGARLIERGQKAEPHKVRDALPMATKPKRRPGKLDLSEHAEQALLISWWSLWAPASGFDPLLLFAIPNAAKRSYSLAAWMTAEGLRRGVPDLFLAKSSPRAYGLFVEMKSRTGKVTPEQAEYHVLLRSAGYQAEVCHGCEQAVRAITRYLGLSAGDQDAQNRLVEQNSGK